MTPQHQPSLRHQAALLSPAARVEWRHIPIAPINSPPNGAVTTSTRRAPAKPTEDSTASADNADSAASVAEEEYRLDNPFAPPPPEPPTPASHQAEYEGALERGEELIALSKAMGGPARVLQQHAKQRMTVRERALFLTEIEPNVLFQNWGENLDGASILTALLNIDIDREKFEEMIRDHIIRTQMLVENALSSAFSGIPESPPNALNRTLNSVRFMPLHMM